MNLQVLVSTMNQEGYNLLEKMKIDCEAVVINQCGKKSKENIEFNKFDIKWINSNKKGLSISRNMAIDNSDSDICLLADDDLIYVDNYKDIIIEQFKLYPKADIITFQIEGIEKKFKNYHSKPRKLNYLTSMKVSSVEIAFKSKSIKDTEVKFNETFGAGAKYFAGEENIFLYDCLKKGLNIQYVPIKIADLHIGESSWFKGYNKEYFIAKGAIFTAMSKAFSIPLILQFAVRKRNLFKAETSILSAIRLMLNGRKQYLNYKID